MAANESWVVEVEWVAGVWTDVTARVDTEKSLIFIEQGDTAETTDEGSASVVLNNSDQLFTPGNINSGYYPNVKSGRRIRIREAIGSYNFVLFTGYIEFPEIEAWTASTPGAPRDQQITITAVDGMTRLANSQEFLSTLGEHILYDGGSSLVAFWPLLTSQGLNPYGPAQLPLTEFVFQESGTVPTAEPALSFDGISVVADDVGTTYLAPNIVSAHAVKYKFPSGPITPIVLDSSTLTFSVWTYIEDVQDAQLQWSIDESTSATFLDLDRSSGVWSITGMTGPVSLLATSIPALPTYKWTLISLRMTLPSGLIECWVDDRTPVTGTMTGGVVPSTATFDNVTVGASQQGNVSYLQVHVGDFTYAQHLAQFQMGLNGLEYQTTGARIRTVLGYAGVASTDLNRVDTGVSVMQRASLAGKTPAIAAAEASSTERGSLYAAGDGQIVFADRKRLYNI